MEEKVKKDGELCDNCGKADSNGVPCYLMFREGTKIESCGAHLEDPAGHAKLVAQNEKTVKTGGKGGRK